jgi:hypothetical protein
MIDRPRIESAKRIIEARLSPDERLMWVGRPDPAKFFTEVARACLLQLALAALFVPVFLFVIFRFSVAAGTVMPMILFVGGVIGFFLISSPWRYPERVSQTIYAITDRRALVHEGVGWSLLWLDALPNLYNPLCSFDARQVRARRRIERYQGRVDLVFGGEGHDYFTGKGQIRDWVQVGFLGLTDVDEVDVLLEKHFANLDMETVSQSLGN